MFKNIQKEVDALEDYIYEQTNFMKDDPFVLTTNLSGECGEVADVIKRLEGKSTKGIDDKTIAELAKEIIDVIFNALRISRYYKIDLDDYFLDRLEKIRRKFSTLERPNNIKIVKDRQELVKYREQQYGTTYSRELNHEYNLYSKFIGKVKNNAKLLDHVCGDGTLKRSFEKSGYKTFACDFSWHALSQASENSPKNLVYSFPDSLPYEDNFFDVVISRRTLHSLPKKIRQKSIKECCRVLKKGGIFICSVQSIDDKQTFRKYKKTGIELKDERKTFVVDVIISGKRTQRIKHFYSIEELTKELEENTTFKVSKNIKVTSKAGWSRDDQNYHVIKATKE